MSVPRPRTARILGKSPTMKPQLFQRYGLQEKAQQAYSKALQTEYRMSGWEAKHIAEAVINKVITNFKASLSPNAASVYLSDTEVLESMIFDAAILAEKMDEAGELDAILNAAQTAEDRAKHDF